MKLNALLLVALVGASIGLTACGEPEGPSIAGDWAVQKPASAATLHAKADHSFTFESVDGQTMSGRWESHGSQVLLYRDIRNGGDTNFGDGGDGASKYTLSKDLQTMTSGTGANSATLKKVK